MLVTGHEYCNIPHEASPKYMSPQEFISVTDSHHAPSIASIHILSCLLPMYENVSSSGSDECKFLHVSAVFQKCEAEFLQIYFA
jgi:hypothetical protein